MQITLNLPDELLQHFSQDYLSREVLEALVVQAYQAEKLPAFYVPTPGDELQCADGYLLLL
jgi:hypothetical protein